MWHEVDPHGEEALCAVSNHEAEMLTCADNATERGEAGSFDTAHDSLGPFLSAGLIPYLTDGEDSAKSQKARQNSEIEGAKF